MDLAGQLGAITKDRDTLQTRLDQLTVENTQWQSERDAARTEAALLRVERDHLAAEGAQLQEAMTQFDDIRLQRDRLLQQSSYLIEELKAGQAEQDRLQATKTQMAHDCAHLQARLTEAMRHCDQLQSDREQLLIEHGNLHAERNAGLRRAHAENEELRRTLDRLAAEHAHLQTAHAAERQAVLQSISWRLTKPLRWLGEAWGGTQP
jgi:chromosome segregation ATPase